MKVSAAFLISKWQGETSMHIRVLFEMAKERRPVILFVDELDHLLSNRRDENQGEGGGHLKSLFLMAMDGTDAVDCSQVYVIGATNLPDFIDTAVLGRFRQNVYVELPTAAERIKLLRHFLRNKKFSLSEADFEYIAACTDQ